MREYTNRLLNYVREGALDAMAVLENVIANYLSEEQVKDFCQSEYEEYFEDEDEADEEDED